MIALRSRTTSAGEAPDRSVSALSRGGELLRLGFEAVHARDVDLSRTPDEQILEWCRARGYIVITPDTDFPTLLVLTRATGPSVIRLEAQGLSGVDVAERVARAISLHAGALTHGALVTIRRRTITVRDLPIPAAGERS